MANEDMIKSGVGGLKKSEAAGLAWSTEKSLHKNHR
jgi:hypothetical protein